MSSTQMVESAQKYWSLIVCHLRKQSSEQKGMVASFKTVYNPEKDYCGMISAEWDLFTCTPISQTGDQAAVRMVVGERPGIPREVVLMFKPQQTLSFAWAVSFLWEAFSSPRLDLILLLHRHFSSTLPVHLALLCYWLWLQPQWKLENRSHSCLSPRSIPSTGLH